MKKYLKNSLGRILVLLAAATIEIFVMLSVFGWFNDKTAWILFVLGFASVVITLAIIKESRHLSFDVMWIVLILLFPIPGAIIYLLLGADLNVSKTFKKICNETIKAEEYYPDDKEVLEEMKEKHPEHKGQFEYISGANEFSFYKNREFNYYSLGELGYPRILEELQKAEKFIFLEYFIIDDGEMWGSILQILEEKAKQGLDVRVMYDDLGSFFLLPLNYSKTLEEKGIKCMPFNRINPILNIIINHRDHRKIMVIDGKVAFSGGINLADEYINAIEKYGVWKDNCFKVTGEAVWSYTIMFLTHWNAMRHEDKTFLSYRAQPLAGEVDGYIAPYGDTPLDDEVCAKSVIMNILGQARDYVFIASPYLIIDSELINALILCAQRSVDVRIIVPGIPDKQIVYMISSSYFEPLLKGGVKIIQYDPGFVHAKIIVSDDIIATAGTVNFDYRSLYLHFENGTLLYDSSAVLDIRKDAESMMEAGHELGLDDCRSNIIKRFFVGILRLFAPMM